ncbi:TPA: DUF3800 domain-containing protein [Streptococcus suis]|nr:DUF3800 domain-containing protein [Streptococcus suis]
MLNLYCDESCHLENDNEKVMLIGGISCPDYARSIVYQEIKEIKLRYGISSHSEIKWRKVSNSKIDFYKELVNYFFDNEYLNFRVVFIDKTKLNHEKFSQTHDDFYYKQYFYLVRKFLYEDDVNVFIDIKDTNSILKVKKLKRILEISSKHNKKVNNIQQIRSHENSIMQLADLLIGAIAYINRGIESSEARIMLCNLISERADHDLVSNTNYNEIKFNIFKMELTTDGK